MRDSLESVIENATGRPRLARDRVLHATSADGLTWRKSRRRPLVHPAHRSPHMTYFTAFDPDGELWVRASVFDHAEGAWYTQLGHGRRWIDVRPRGVRHLYSPRWHADRVYGVTGDAVVAFATGADHAPATRVDQEWEGLDRFAVVQDLDLVRAERRVVAFVSVGPTEDELEIHSWSSIDGTRWLHEGCALASPTAGAYRLVNNPSVVALPDGGYRMYFRTGDRPVLGNTIRSAHSGNLREWAHEDGDRIEPGGTWDTHGVGFPHVWRDGDWQMLYAGYWGRTPKAEPVARRWAARA